MKRITSIILFGLLASIASMSYKSTEIAKYDAATSDGEAYRVDAEMMDFDIGENWRYFYSNGNKTSGEIGVHSGTIYGCRYEIHDVMLKHVDSNGYFAYFYRVTMTPNKSDYLVNGWCNTIVEMSQSYLQIINFAPQNSATSIKGSVSIGADSSGMNVGFSVYWTHSDLTISSATTAPRHYETSYSYNNGIVPYDWCSDLLKNTVYNYGALIFKTHANPTMASIKIKHDIGFNKAP